MMHKKYTIGLMIMFLFSYCFTLFSQDQIMIKEGDVNAILKINNQKGFWQICKDVEPIEVTLQKCEMIDGRSYFVSCYKFNTEVEAINGTAYLANSYSTPFPQGSHDGNIIGNISWGALTANAVCFQEENYGVKIFCPHEFNQEVVHSINVLKNNVRSKIKSDIKKDSLILKEIENDQNLSRKLEKSNIYLNGSKFLLQNTLLIKWIGVSETDLVYGIRNEWNNNSSIVCIDVLKYASNFEAEKAMLERCKMTSCFSVGDMGIQVSRNELKTWRDRWKSFDKINTSTIAGISDNYLICLYFSSPNELDIDFCLEVLSNF